MWLLQSNSNNRFKETRLTPKQPWCLPFLLPPKHKSNMLDYQILRFALGFEHHSGSPGLFTFDSESKRPCWQVTSPERGTCLLLVENGAVWGTMLLCPRGTAFLQFPLTFSKGPQWKDASVLLCVQGKTKPWWLEGGPERALPKRTLPSVRPGNCANKALELARPEAAP